MSDLEIIERIGISIDRDLKEYPLYELFDDFSKMFFRRNSYALDDHKRVIALSISDIRTDNWGFLKILKEFSILNKLQIFNCEINDLSFLVETIPLTFLDLDMNNITNISQLECFKNLTDLRLSQNRISDISPLKELKKLTLLDLQLNQIEDLRYWICDFDAMDVQWEAQNSIKNGFITLFGNPLKQDFIKQQIAIGKESLKDGFNALKKGKVENTYVKLILIGNTRVGKSTLAEMFRTGECERNKLSTHGLKTWQPEGKDLQISIWDFGGQEYYHGTYRLFFSDHSLYVLVWTKRKNNYGECLEEIPVYSNGKVIHSKVSLKHYPNKYWLQNINQLCAKYSNCPKIMVQTNTGNDKFEEKEAECSSKYGVEKQDFHIDTLNAADYNRDSTLTDLEDYWTDYKRFRKHLLERLQYTIFPSKIPYYWREMLNAIIKIQKKRTPYLRWTDYETICKNRDKDIEIEALTRYLHNAGILLHFSDNSELKEKVYINPEYLKDSIYKVLDLKVKNANGVFTGKHVKKIMGNEAKAFIELMKADRFGLIFKEPKLEDTYIAVQYLEDEYSDKDKLNWAVSDINTFCFAFSYPIFMSPDIMIKFLSYFGEFADLNLYWKNGVVLLIQGIKIYVYSNSNSTGQKIFIKTSAKRCKIPILRDIYTKLFEFSNDILYVHFSENEEDFAPLETWINFAPGLDHFWHDFKRIERNLFNYLHRVVQAQPYTRKEILEMLKEAYQKLNTTTDVQKKLCDIHINLIKQNIS